MSSDFSSVESRPSRIIPVAVLLWVVSGVSANPVTYLGPALTRETEVSYHGVDLRVPAGLHRISFDGAELWAYSVDLDHPLLNQWEASAQGVDVLHAGRAIGWLHDTYAKDVSSNTTAAGMQIALWEIVTDYDGTYDLTSGDFRVGAWNESALIAESYLASVRRYALEHELATYLSSSFMIFPDATTPSQHLLTPEPHHGLLFTLMAVSAAFRGTRSNRRKSDIRRAIQA